MNKQICKYSIIRFQPFPETEEFANIGVVLFATNSKRLEFRLLEAKQHAKITTFFAPMNKEVFVHTNKIIRGEIERIKRLIEETRNVNIDLFAEMIRNREDIIQFSEARAMFTTDPVATIEKLFAHYVHRSFAQEPGYEDKMKQQVHELLIRCNLGDVYKDGAIGEPDRYEVKFPFVRKVGPQKVIKPIHFRHDKPTKLIDHGHLWLSKVQQLDRCRFIKPEEILFAYDAPNRNEANLYEAFEGIKDQALQIGIVMADIRATNEIEQFAS